MLRAQIIVNLLLKLGHGVDMADHRCLERSFACGEHNLLDKQCCPFVHLMRDFVSAGYPLSINNYSPGEWSRRDASDIDG